jgi:hypothetical protein
MKRYKRIAAGMVLLSISGISYACATSKPIPPPSKPIPPMEYHATLSQACEVPITTTPVLIMPPEFKARNFCQCVSEGIWFQSRSDGICYKNDM